MALNVIFCCLCLQASAFSVAAAGHQLEEIGERPPAAGERFSAALQYLANRVDDLDGMSAVDRMRMASSLAAFVQRGSSTDQIVTDFRILPPTNGLKTQTTKATIDPEMPNDLVSTLGVHAHAMHEALQMEQRALTSLRKSQGPRALLYDVMAAVRRTEGNNDFHFERAKAIDAYIQNNGLIGDIVPSIGHFAYGLSLFQGFYALFKYNRDAVRALSAARARKQTFVVLGSGCGSEGFFAALWLGLPTIGMDVLCSLVSRAEDIRQAFEIPDNWLQFRCADALKVHFALPRQLHEETVERQLHEETVERQCVTCEGDDCSTDQCTVLSSEGAMPSKPSAELDQVTIPSAGIVWVDDQVWDETVLKVLSRKLTAELPADSLVITRQPDLYSPVRHPELVACDPCSANGRTQTGAIAEGGLPACCGQLVYLGTFSPPSGLMPVSMLQKRECACGA